MARFSLFIPVSLLVDVEIMPERDPYLRLNVLKVDKCA